MANTATRVRPRSSTGQEPRRQARAHRLFVAPTILAIVVLGAYPLLFILAGAFSDSTLGKPFRNWVGTENLEVVLADGDVVASIVRTVLYALGVSVVSVGLGVVIALALERATRSGAVVRTLLLLPLITPPVVVGTLWKLVFNPGGGLLDTLLRGVGVEGASIAPLSSTFWALPAIGLADVWQWTPLVTLLVYAALLTQDPAVREAASLDGAHGFSLFREITWPAVAGTVAAVFFIRLVIALKVFDLVFIMTSGGPGVASTTTSYVIYQVALKEFDIGRASAITLVFAVVVTLVTIPFAVLTRRLTHD
ncbi:multiple sugar transport system permease protein [Microbacteriaceae bacterium SG_E_30_P1]|uniref:Multiple sugar transport system permease protein n=1 Tax=Antiquaquibacter oligotrophicus TaxID=2880260 RepID=A0ABT6KNX8_9MICO|nr:sugar ABC transporter permease [Antiquaquibacter oligotrophicus]MDH6181710.1 multiple sugar transport system permease protein [Antiquaquibacter oligotrophicus]UDF12607.1 sugar ABC transporter permease [Antiquaquibacter oligotrophicus]